MNSSSRNLHAMVLAALLSLMAFAAPADALPSDADIEALVGTSDFKIENFRLKNGLEVVVIPDHRMPVVTHMIWYRIGAADEMPGESGIAHFLEHLMFKGTKKIAPGDFSRIVARNGGEDNAFTSWDYTAYYQRVARDRLELMMTMEADRAQNLVLSDAVVLPERDVIQEERRQVVENRPERVLTEQMNAALYRNHRYGVPIIGWMHEIAELTREDALRYYARAYAPGNAILIVSGDVTAADLRPLAEKTYGRLKPVRLPPRERAKEPPQVSARRVVLEDSRAEQSSLRRVYLSAQENAAPAEAAALDVAAQILGGSATSRLYRELVLKRKLAASASAGNWTTRLDNGEFSLNATPRPGVSVETLEAAIDEVLEEFLKAPPTAEELQTAKFNLIASAAYLRDDAEDLAYALGVGLTTGQTIAEIKAWPARIAAVDAEAVRAAAKKTLDRGRSVTGILLPAADEGDAP